MGRRGGFRARKARRRESVAEMQLRLLKARPLAVPLDMLRSGLGPHEPGEDTVSPGPNFSIVKRRKDSP